MNSKLKIAILAMLGFSTACCAQKKAAKRSQDQEPTKIEADSIDTRIMLMYGVPSPDGKFPAPMTEQEAIERAKALAEEERMKSENSDVTVQSYGEMIKEKGDSVLLEMRVMYGVAYPDGTKPAPMTEEEAKKKLEEIRAAEESAKQEAVAETQE